MSRGVKDLREIVCRSRQSFATDAVLSSDEESTSVKTPENVSENGYCFTKPPGSQRAHSQGSKSARSRQKLGNCNGIEHHTASSNGCDSSTSVQNSYGGTRHKSIIYNDIPDDVSCNTLTSENEKQSCEIVTECLKHFKRKTAITWLENVRCVISTISEWCQKDENFVRFSHSWLSLYSEEVRNEMLLIEYDAIKAQLFNSFSSDAKIPTDSLMSRFLSVILHEYAKGRFSGSEGAAVFIDYMDGIASSANRNALLSNIPCSRALLSAQNYECVLAVRSHTMVTMLHGILKQYDQRQSSNGTAQMQLQNAKPKTLDGHYTSRPSTSRRPKTAQRREDNHSETIKEDSQISDRIYQAIRLGFVDIVQFLLESGRVPPDIRDSNNKTLVFHAVASAQHVVLRYLLTRPDCRLYVNVAADSGNTPLHVAANRGDVAITEELLRVKELRIDAKNHLCDNATPLHLAAMHGHREIVGLLVKAGANPSLSMDDRTASDIARDFEHLDIVEILATSHSLQNSQYSSKIK